MPHELVEDFGVVVEGGGFGVAQGDVGLVELVEGWAVGGGVVAEVGGLEAAGSEDVGVGGGFDVDRVGAGGGGQAQVGVEGVDGFEGCAVGGVAEAFALEAGAFVGGAEVDECFDGVSGPGVGDGGGEPEPGGAPGGSPGLADVGGFVGGVEGFGDVDGFAWGVPDGDVHGLGVGVLGGFEALVQDAVEALFDDVAVVVHGAAPWLGAWVWC